MTTVRDLVLRRARPLVLVVVLAGLPAAQAQAAAIIRNSNLRPTPSSRESPITLLHAGDSIEVTSATASHGYLRGQATAREQRVDPPERCPAPTAEAPA
jgi:hypothetical protein